MADGERGDFESSGDLGHADDAYCQRPGGLPCVHRAEDQAAALDAKADEIEAALMESAREMVGWLEQHASYTRTGHHSARTGSGGTGTAWSPADRRERASLFVILATQRRW